MAAGFGLVGLDRWIIAPLFPFMARELHLNYAQLGGTLGILAVAWGLFAIPIGWISDRIGRRLLLCLSILMFSLLSGLTGFATTFGALIALRALVGACEGAFLPISVAVTADASRPDRVGRNEGLQLGMFALLGLGFGPIIATQMLAVVPSWRWVYGVAAVPGLVVAVLMFVTVRERRAPPGTAERSTGSWLEVLRTRNIVLAILALLCAMCGVFVLGAMLPSYLLDALHLTPAQMGFVTSAIGFGGFAGQFGVAASSDHLGRRTMGCIAFLASAALVYLFAQIGPQPALLFAVLLLASFFCFGLLALFTGPVATEAVSATYTASAVGLVAGCAEIFGGGIAPVIAGQIAQRFGIAHIFSLAIGGLLAGTVFAALLVETAPCRRATGRHPTARR